MDIVQGVAPSARCQRGHGPSDDGGKLTFESVKQRRRAGPAAGRHAVVLASGLAVILAAVIYGWAVSPMQLPLARAGEPVPTSDHSATTDITALAMELTACTGRVDDARLLGRQKMLARFLGEEASQSPDGRETSFLAFGLMMLAGANKDRVHDGLIQRTTARVKGAQWEQSRGLTDSDPRFGGTGYRPSASPDLYHTALAIESLYRAGVPGSDPYMQRAARFVSRCQVVPAEGPAASPNNAASDRGGFAIAPAEFDEAKGETTPGEMRRPCGSLTCAGLKSLIYCGVPKTDARVQAGLDWLRRHYTLTANPGMSVPRCRLYDYYLSLATAMAVLGEESIVDRHSVPHNWRRELQAVLRAEQQPNGSWLNLAESDNFPEAQPVVTTSLAVMTLCQTMKPREESLR